MNYMLYYGKKFCIPKHAQIIIPISRPLGFESKIVTDSHNSGHPEKILSLLILGQPEIALSGIQ